MMMKKKLLINFFSGTGSSRRLLEVFPSLQREIEVIEIDIDPRFNPDIVCDIMEFDYISFLIKNEPYMLWFSPPCTEVSKIKVHGERDLETALKLFNRVKMIIDFATFIYPNVYFCIENPATGLLCKPRDETKSRGIYYDRIDIFDCYPHQDVDYCRYSINAKTDKPIDLMAYEFPYKKATRIWTNIKVFKGKTCLGKDKCDWMVPGTRRHLATYGSINENPKRYKVDTDFMHRIPVLLLLDLFKAAYRQDVEEGRV